MEEYDIDESNESDIDIDILLDDLEESESVEKFDLEDANKLLKHIRRFADLKSFQVPDPVDDNMGTTTLKEWVKYYYDRVEESGGGTGLEVQVFQILYLIEQDWKVHVVRVEDGFRKIISVLERRGKRIKLLRDVIKKKSKDIETLKTMLKNKSEKPIEQLQSVPAVVESGKEKYQPRKKKSGYGIDMGINVPLNSI